MSCLLAIGVLGMAPAANAASAWQFVPKRGESAATDVIEIRKRGRDPRLYLPIAPNYNAYDYPYYYSRGFYPTHIGPGYIYYGHPYSYYRSLYYPKYGGRCSNRFRRCVAKWDYDRRRGPTRHLKVRRN
ncbi:MAG: hypothetical protein ACKVP4_12165 [Hyphomicrobium sp.]